MIFKISIISIFLLCFSCKNSDKQDFKVFGNEEILKDCKVNVFKYYDSSVDEKKYTLLHLGKKHEVNGDNDNIGIV